MWSSERQRKFTFIWPSRDNNRPQVNVNNFERSSELRLSERNSGGIHGHGHWDVFFERKSNSIYRIS